MKKQIHTQPLLGNQRGMTLLEIMIVLVIIVSMVAFLGSAVSSRYKKAQRNEAIIRIAELSKAIEQFYADCGSYPASLAELTTAPGSCPNWGPTPYVKKDLLKDPWKNDLQYSLQGSTYVITSYGADKQPGGDGVNADITNGQE